MFFLNFLAILPVDSQTSSAPFPSITLPDIDLANFAIRAIFIIVWIAISLFAMRAALFGFKWGTASTDEEYYESSKNMFIQSAGGILICGLLLVVISVLRGVLGVA